MMQEPTIAAAEAAIIEEFSLFDNWDEKYEYIIELGKRLPPLDAKYKTDDYRVRGCQSTVYLGAEYENGRIQFKADSDSVIVKGLISMLVRVLSGRTPEEILAAKLEFIDRIGMRTHLAQTRSNGLLAMVKQMKHYALAFQVKTSQS